MIDRSALLTRLKALTSTLVEDLTTRTDEVEEVHDHVRGEYARAQSAGRTDRSYVEWREDLLNQVAVAWVLGCVFVRFCEDNGLVDDPLLSGPGERRRIAQDFRLAWLTDRPEAGDREWLEEVFRRYQALPATAGLFADTNPLWQVGPSADGARSLLDVWWDLDESTGELAFDFTDPEMDSRFLGDLYQDLSDHAKKTYALLQTPEFVESFILDRTLDPAIEEFGLDELKMIDPTCGSGHFLLGSFHRLFNLWQQREPGTHARELAQRALDGVHGVDLNPFAVAVARFRLLVAALKASGIGRLADSPAFRINLATGDSLLHGTTEQRLFGGDDVIDRLKQHHYATEDADEADRILEAGRYHAVVGNPPYITVKDKALNKAYRGMYETCHRQYSLGVPFTERFWDLAAAASSDGPAGYVGMITANSFMKREFGKKLIQEWLPQRDLTHVIDTSGAYIPGHGTPTVILFGRRQAPVLNTVRAVLGIRGEPGKPTDPARGEVWTSILGSIEVAGREDEYTSSEDANRESYGTHPWSLQGGAAPAVLAAINQGVTSRLGQRAQVGSVGITGEDAAFATRTSTGVPTLLGDAVRDWAVAETSPQIWPYEESRPSALVPFNELPWTSQCQLWPLKHRLLSRKLFGVPLPETDVAWYEWREFRRDKLWNGDHTIAFPLVATHNHFVLLPSGTICRHSAPVIKLPETATEADHLRLLGLLNSSTACFWMKQVFYPKGGDKVGQEGARLSKTVWGDRYEFDGTKLQQFPIPRTAPTDLATQLDILSQQLAAALPETLIQQAAPTRVALNQSEQRVAHLRRRMVALQEELDWSTYAHYGITEAPLTADPDSIPDLNRGERAFEIILARQVAAGEKEPTWFERHGSTPITELPSHWPAEYRELVERRIALIESDRAINLMERPEYKRRWNWDSWEDLAKDALRSWLLDRLESPDVWDAELTTTARLAERFRGNAEFLEAAQLYTDAVDVDLAELVRKLVLDEAVPYLSELRYKATGLKKRKAWEETWDLQRAEDVIDARDDLSDDEKALEKKHQGLDAIPVPPKYKSSDFAKTNYWKLRGKLDVPKERFILYPDTRIGEDSSPVIGWAGWNHLEQAQALAAHYTQRQSEAAESDELRPLLAGLAELVPWLKQWHNDLDETYGQRLGDFYESFFNSEHERHGPAPE
ncbi:putative DNA methylase [Euzebya pacifica]|uniref:site-specific DNA-methyltransferase (adenine-specific) n=1 Tax=Euzebya pacifica TaxID=1608957 RepID=A0A346XRY4_9ACTN|nr:BREX-2 system adenine-specific DNA-methyltransferase PglX [Euzebya pacifica]AXV04981.1 putative DNA methylase [Euzebya pacifica]